MKRFIVLISCVLGVVLLFQLSSCKKDRLLTEGGRIGFSTDTLYFDTVFTTMGSVTKEFKIYNRNDRSINLSSIRLEKGSSSFFRLNVDGVATKDISDIEIAPNDSVYVFAAVTVDPNLETTPFVIDDKVLVVLNGENYEVPFQAYGQNAHIIRDSVLTTQTWVNDLPYVIINSALVDSANTLTIQKGCRIYMHANSKLFVGGTLNCFGTKEDSIVFQGDRLDRDYFGQDFPGEWRGLHFLSSSMMSNLNHVIIKNGGASDASVYAQPPWVEFSNNRYMLEMNKCKIYNSLGFGVLAFQTAINMTNCLVYQCGKQNFACLQGGRYKINYCTFSTYGGNGIAHINEPVMALWNYLRVSPTELVAGDLKVEMNNTIIYGSQETELVFPQVDAANYDVNIRNCLFRTKDAIPSYVRTGNNILNQNPQFEDRLEEDYSVKDSSPCKGAADPLAAFIDDIIDNNRSATPTIGCYE